MTETKLLTKDHVDSALLALHKIHDVLGYLIRDDVGGRVRTLCECANTLYSEAADHLDRPWPEGGAS